jgi:hypothetical protein
MRSGIETIATSGIAMLEIYRKACQNRVKKMGTPERGEVTLTHEARLLTAS